MPVSGWNDPDAGRAQRGGSRLEHWQLCMGLKTAYLGQNIDIGRVVQTIADGVQNVAMGELREDSGLGSEGGDGLGDELLSPETVRDQMGIAVGDLQHAPEGTVHGLFALLDCPAGEGHQADGASRHRPMCEAQPGRGKRAWRRCSRGPRR